MAAQFLVASVVVGQFSTTQARQLQEKIILSMYNVDVCEILVTHFNLEKNMASVSLRLPDEISDRLDQLAKATGRSKTFYMIEAIRDHLDDLEDLYLAEQRLIDVRAGRSKTYTLDEVERDLGLAD